MQNSLLITKNIEFEIPTEPRAVYDHAKFLLFDLKFNYINRRSIHFVSISFIVPVILLNITLRQFCTSQSSYREMFIILN